MKKKINIAKIIWISSIFLFLIVVLVMVMDYKINYQYSKPSEKLYFYDCDNSLCTSTTKENNKTIYSSYDCWYSTCPEYKKIIYDDYVLLKESEKSYILYNYKTGATITSGYLNYEFINNDYIIVKKNNNKYGIIDINDNVTVSPSYDEIGYYENKLLTGYNTNSIIAKKGKKYGIISYKDGKVIESFTYDEDEIEKLLEKIAVS